MFRIHLIITLLFSAILFGCKQEPVATTSSQAFLIQPGDIVVANSGSDSIHLMDADGNFKRVLYSVNTNSESIYGLAWKSDTKEVIFTVNGSNRVGAISVVDGSYRVFISDTNLTGTLRGLTQLTTGEILISETNNIEKYTTNGIRVTTGSWPKALLTTPEQIVATSDGGFILCSTGTDAVRVYTSAGVQTATASSGIAATTDTYGCTVLSDGSIATTFSGTTDTVSTFTSTLTGQSNIYSDTFILSSPRMITQASNGNLLIADSVAHYIVEVETDGTFVRQMGGSFLNAPVSVLSIPSY